MSDGSEFPPWLEKILGDFSALGHTTYLDDPLLGFGHAALNDPDELGVPRFSREIPRLPVALFERHHALWTHPDTDGGRQEVWTVGALRHGMARIPGPGVHHLPTLDGWVIGLMGTTEGHATERAGGPAVRGLQLQQPDGAPFLYTVLAPDPGWIDTATTGGWVLVLHGPQLGVRGYDLRPHRAAGHADPGDRAQLLRDARTDGLVTGGLVAWGRPRPS